ncbi:MAG: squalene/phytoene synthase family protein, partial [Crocinitomicaceae bacterium]|nr:squalene/phytoene synthase family protein [Crocinitomicaceae bacterium]
MKVIFDNISHEISRLTTRRYSTSFSLGIHFLNKKHHKAIYGIYGFVRFADEIVDSFHDYNKQKLFDEFSSDTFNAIANKISLNPILNSFQWAVNKYNIPHDLIHSFLHSMEMDLNEDALYDEDKFKKYILGSAEVVGLMCLKVFVEGDEEDYKELKPCAMSLGSAFQKINFLRDIKNDFHSLGRSYFPDVYLYQFNDLIKKDLELDI